jgi:hypothetical protein
VLSWLRVLPSAGIAAEPYLANSRPIFCFSGPARDQSDAPVNYGYAAPAGADGFAFPLIKSKPMPGRHLPRSSGGVTTP